MNRFANPLIGLGLANRDTVAKPCLNSTALVIAACGITKTGRVWVPTKPLMRR